MQLCQNDELDAAKSSVSGNCLFPIWLSRDCNFDLAMHGQSHAMADLLNSLRFLFLFPVLFPVPFFLFFSFSYANLWRCSTTVTVLVLAIFAALFLESGVLLSSGLLFVKRGHLALSVHRLRLQFKHRSHGIRRNLWKKLGVGRKVKQLVEIKLLHVTFGVVRLRQAFLWYPRWPGVLRHGR